MSLSVHHLALGVFDLIIFLTSLLNVVQLTTQLDNFNQPDAIFLVYIVHHLYNLWPGKEIFGLPG